MRRRLSFFLFAFAIAGVTAQADEGTGLKLSAAVDAVANLNLNSGNTQPNQIMARGAEISLYAPADHLFDGTLSVAAHGNEPDVGVELHEAWIGSTKLIPRSRFRLGQFFLGIGRLNQFHQHDWPFIGTPRAHNDFFAFEAVFDTGFEYSYLFPLPFFLEATVGLTNGFVFGHSHARSSALPPKMGTHYGRLATYTPLPWDGGAQFGVSYLGNHSRSDIELKLIGVDFTAKWKEIKRNLMLIQGELWYRQRGVPSAIEEALGGYLYPEYYLGEDFFLGVRLDYFSVLNQKDSSGSSLVNVEWNFSPTISYKPSEFVTFRLAYNHRPETNFAFGTRTQKYLEFQSVFILGSHPAHEF